MFKFTGNLPGPVPVATLARSSGPASLPVRLSEPAGRESGQCHWQCLSNTFKLKLQLSTRRMRDQVQKLCVQQHKSASATSSMTIAAAAPLAQELAESLRTIVGGYIPMGPTPGACRTTMMLPSPPSSPTCLRQHRHRRRPPQQHTRSKTSRV